jgi:hypothetical protein
LTRASPPTPPGTSCRASVADSRLLNSQYVGPRLLRVARRSYREDTGWLPNLALYLFQLDALAGRNQAALRAA